MTDAKTQNEILKDRVEQLNIMWDASVLEQNLIQQSPELTEQAIKASEEMYKLVKLLKEKQ